MTVAPGFEFPPDKRETLRRAKRLEWITIGYLLSAIFFLYLTLGSSQAMKTAWIEDMLSLIPPIAFLVATKVRDRRPTERFPYGFHRAVAIAFLCAALALTLMGALLLFDSATKLLAFEHPSIGVVQPTGEPIWLGWLMIAALLYSAIPAVILGRMKIPLGKELHDKVLYADSEMNKADWMTAGAAILGIIGIGLGLWWADSVAAIVISAGILHDGFGNLKAVIADLLDRVPTSVDHKRVDALPARLETELKALPWVTDVKLRMREEGHVYLGEAFVVFTDHSDLLSRIDKTLEKARSVDWRVHDLVVVPVGSVDDPTGASAPQGSGGRA